MSNNNINPNLVNVNGKNVSNSIINAGPKGKIKTGKVSITRDVPSQVLLKEAERGGIFNAIISNSEGGVETEDVTIVEKVSDPGSTLTTDGKTASTATAQDQIVFTVKETSFTASRSLLLQNAPQFASIVQNGQKLSINTVEPVVFEALLAYVQTKTVDENFLKQNAEDVYEAAMRFKVPELKAKALKFLN